MASSTPTTIYAYSTESRTYTVNFANFAELIAGDTLTGTPTVTSDPNDESLVITSKATSTPNVTFRATGGVVGTQYLINCTATTTAGATLLTQCNLTINNT